MIYVFNMESSCNFPKYLIVIDYMADIDTFSKVNVFYYLVSSYSYMGYYLSVPIKFPNYIIVYSLYFKVHGTDNKFDLSKLGTDYIINDMCTHFKSDVWVAILITMCLLMNLYGHLKNTEQIKHL